jgi:hypothetical protein
MVHLILGKALFLVYMLLNVDTFGEWDRAITSIYGRIIGYQIALQERFIQEEVKPS